MRLFKLSISLLLATISLTSVAQQKISLKEGEKYNVETVVKLTSVASVMGQEMESTAETKTTLEYKVAEVGSTGIDLKRTLTKMQVTASAMGQETKYDSDKKDNDGPGADKLGTMVNKEKKLTIDHTGSITKQDKADDEQSPLTGLDNKNGTTTELFIPVFFTKELKAGDSFPDISNISAEKFQSRDSGVYTVTAIDNGIASISYTGTTTVAATMEQMGMEMQTTSTGTLKSEMQVDLKTGIVIAKASVAESTMNIEAAGMSIPATSKTITTVKISKVE